MVRFTFEEAQRLAGKLEAEVRSESQLWNRRSGWKDSAIASLKAALAGVPGGLSKPGSRFWVCDGCYHVNRIAMDHCADCGARAPHAYEPAAAREVRRLREA